MSILKHIFGMLLGLIGLLAIAFAVWVAFVADSPLTGIGSAVAGIIAIMLAKRLNKAEARQ